MLRQWVCPSRQTHYFAIGRSKAIKVDLILAEASQSDDAATADTVTVAWFGDSDWSDVTSVLRDFLHEQIKHGTLGAKEHRRPKPLRRNHKVIKIEVHTDEESLTLLQPPAVLAAAKSHDDSVRCLRTNSTFLRVFVAADTTPSGKRTAEAIVRAAGKRPRVEPPPVAAVTTDEADTGEADAEPRETDPTPATAKAVVVRRVSRVIMKDGVIDLSEISSSVISAEIKSIAQDLWSIYSGKTESWRHQAYRKKGKERAELKHKVRFGTFSEDQQETFLDDLTTKFCKKSKYLNYVMDVLMPEAMIRVTARLLGIPHTHAEAYLDSPSVVTPEMVTAVIETPAPSDSGRAHQADETEATDPIEEVALVSDDDEDDDDCILVDD